MVDFSPSTAHPARPETLAGMVETPGERPGNRPGTSTFTAAPLRLPPVR